MSGRKSRSSAALAFPAGHPRAEEVSEALIRAGAAETLEDLYDAWLRLRLARASSAADRSREAAQLEVRAEYLLKSVASARGLQPLSDGKPAKARRGGKAALATATDPYAGFLESAERELDAARRELAGRGQREEQMFGSEIEAIQARILERVETTLALQPPRVEAVAQPVGADKALMHLVLPRREDALLLAFVLSGKLPTRHEAFYDDSVDDLSLPPARFYDEDGVPARPASVDEEDAIAADPARRFVPAKGMIAFRIPGHDFPRLRLINQGPLAQVEAREEAAASYQQLLARPTAELISGLLIRLEVEKRLKLALKVG